tara:strand:- start:104333 stop:104557 length:225 start_codon:yes stop_codon:yes gene_type:complete
MSETKPEMSGPKDTSYENRLHPEDQARVDGFIKRGVNSVERKPFRPLRLLLILIGVVLGLSLFSQFLARWAGVY